MAEQIELHTTDLPLVLNREFYDDLVDNFLTIEKWVNGDTSGESGDDKIEAEISSLKQRINNIAVSGIDQIALENAVEDVLKRKGVI